MKIQRFLCSLAVSALLISPAARAQLRNHDAFFGYSRSGSDLFYPSVGGLNGWDGALHIHVMPFLGIEGDVAHYGLGADSSTPRTTTFLAGPRATVKALGIHLFAHGLIGGEHSPGRDTYRSSTAFTYAIGGGLDVPILPFFALRIGADHIAAPGQTPSGATQARFNTGLVLRF